MKTALGAEIPSTTSSTTEGKAQRETVPRTAHADLVDRPKGFDPIQILIDQGDGPGPRAPAGALRTHGRSTSSASCAARPR